MTAISGFLLPSSNSSKPQRIPELDVLRGLACVIVVIFHYITVFQSYYTSSHPPIGMPYGVFAVHLFFMISGFVIFLTLSNTRTALDFFVSRFSRLFPVFWVAVLLTFVVVKCSNSTDLVVTWREAIINLTMLAGPLHVRYVDTVYWSLVIELEFYVVMLAIFRAGWLRYVERLAVLWLSLQLIGAYLTSRNLWAIPEVIRVLLLLKYAHLFIAGIISYKIRFEGQTPIRWGIFLACLLTEFVLQGMAAGICSIFFFLLFFAVAVKRLEWVAVRPLVFLGTISYSLYLIHCNIGFVIMRGMSAYPRWTQLIVAAISVLFLATALTFMIEQPALHAVRRWYKKVKGNRLEGQTLANTAVP